MTEALTLTFRAVEVFIRDKYERKTFYNKEAMTAASVSTTNTSSFYIYNNWIPVGFTVFHYLFTC